MQKCLSFLYAAFIIISASIRAMEEPSADRYKTKSEITIACKAQVSALKDKINRGSIKGSNHVGQAQTTLTWWEGFTETIQKQASDEDVVTIILATLGQIQQGKITHDAAQIKKGLLPMLSEDLRQMVEKIEMTDRQRGKGSDLNNAINATKGTLITTQKSISQNTLPVPQRICKGTDKVATIEQMQQEKFLESIYNNPNKRKLPAFAWAVQKYEEIQNAKTVTTTQTEESEDSHTPITAIVKQEEKPVSTWASKAAAAPAFVPRVVANQAAPVQHTVAPHNYQRPNWMLPADQQKPYTPPVRKPLAIVAPTEKTEKDADKKGPNVTSWRSKKN